MSWSEHVFSYCERGQSTAFWAEPANALSNAAFLVAALLAAATWRRSRAELRGWAEPALIALAATIGFGSLVFHTVATRWAVVADVAPIGAFMIGYAGYALRRFCGLSVLATAAGVFAFVALLAAAPAVPCPGVVRALVAGASCLNGSVGYLPALAMLAGVGIAARRRGHRAAAALLVAAVVFAASLVARSLDVEVCAATRVLGQPRGTHAIWHLLNALVVWLLLDAAVRHGKR